MNKKLIIPEKIICADKDDNIFYNTAVEVNNGTITRLIDAENIDTKKYDGEILNLPGLTLIPGFVQTHVHLCQTLFRGLAEEMELLDWLKLRIFPYENAHNVQSLKFSAKLGINELLLGGTTTIMDMGTLRNHEVVFEELINSGIRAISGKCMIDENDIFPAFKQSTKDELSSTLELAKEYHNKDNGRIKYGFAPRFVLSCTEELLVETKQIMKDFPGSMYHTHSSENKNEIGAVREKYNKDNIEYFNSIGVLGDHTILAHCVHTSEEETAILKETNTRVAHCPSANLKLGSGIAPIPKYINGGISVSIGADGAPCNNNLDAFTEMRLASLIQKPIHGPKAMSAKTVFKLSTIEGAKALNLQDDIGSIEPGKRADMVLIDLKTSSNSLKNNPENLFSDIVYSSSPKNIRYVMVNGNWVVKEGESLVYDETEIVKKGREELIKLLKRVE